MKTQMNCMFILLALVSLTLAAPPASAGLIETEFAKVVKVRALSTYDRNRPTYFQLEGITGHKKCKSADWGEGDLTIWQVPFEDRSMRSKVEEAELQGLYLQVISNDSFAAKGEGGICQVINLDSARPR